MLDVLMSVRDTDGSPRFPAVVTELDQLYADGSTVSFQALRGSGD